MKKLLKLVAGLLLGAVTAVAQTHTAANLDTANVYTSLNQFVDGATLGPLTFSQLSALLSPLDGTIVWVPDATAQNPCVGSGSGAFAFRENGAWQCAIAGSGGGGSGTVNAGTLNHLYKNVSAATVGDSSVVDNGSTVSTTEPFSSSTITSTVSTGTAPLTVSSTTVVPNLNVSQLLGKTWASPADIGTSVPGQGFFTNLSVSGTCTNCLTGAVLLSPAGSQTVATDNGVLDFDGTDGISISHLGSFPDQFLNIYLGSGGFGRIEMTNSSDVAVSALYFAPTGLGGFSSSTGVIEFGSPNTILLVAQSSTGIGGIGAGIVFPGGNRGNVQLVVPDVIVDSGGSTTTAVVTLPKVTGTLLTNQDWSAPGPIGTLAPNTAIFTNLTVTGTCTGCGTGGGGGGGTWGSITGTLSSQTDLQTALNAKLNAGLAVLLAPSTAQTVQPSSSSVIGLTAKCPVSASGTLACFQVQDNAGGVVLSALQNDTVQFGTGVGGTMQLTGVVGPNANSATAGLLRNSDTDVAVMWRNHANTGNLGLAKTTADILTSDMAVAVKETTAGSGIAGYAVLYEDASTHLLEASLNNGSFLVVPLETGGMTSGHLVSVNSTTNLIQDSGLVLANVLLGTATNHGVALGSTGQTLGFTAAGTSGQCLLSNGSSADPSYQTCPSASTSTLSGITAATGANSINNGDFAQVWNWQGTSSGRIALKITENTASTSAGTPVLFQVSALSTSTMNPVQFDANGNGLRMDTTGKLAKIGTGSIDVASLSSVTGTGAAVLATGATSVTLDAEGSSNVLTRPFYVEFTGACNSTTAGFGSFDVPTSAAATATCFGTTTTQGAIDYIDGSTTTVTGHFTLPQGWTGNMDARVVWFANVASSNAVRWLIQTGCVADSSAISTGPSYNTAGASNTAYTGTANQRKTTLLSALPMTNCAAGNTMYFLMQRIGGDAGDTLTATAELLALQFEGRTTK